MYEFSQINVLSFAQIHDEEESLANNSRQIAIGQQCYLVDAFRFVIRLRCQVLEDVLEVRYCDILFELLVVENLVVNELNFIRCCLVVHCCVKS